MNCYDLRILKPQLIMRHTQESLNTFCVSSVFLGKLYSPLIFPQSNP